MADLIIIAIIAAFTGFVCGFILGNRDMECEWQREQEAHWKWFDAYMNLANQIAEDKVRRG